MVLVHAATSQESVLGQYELAVVANRMLIALDKKKCIPVLANDSCLLLVA